MSKYLLFVAIIFTRLTVYAETIKTGVLVIGGTYSGIAAAVQCAHSKVKTVLIEPSDVIGFAKTGTPGLLSTNAALPSGLWGDFRRKVQAQYKPVKAADTVFAAPLHLTTAASAHAVKQLTDTLKMLTLMPRTQWTGIKKDGTGWEVIINREGRTETIKAQVLIDATETGAAALKAGAVFTTDADHQDSTGRQLVGLMHLSVDDVYAPYRTTLLYRTSVAVTDGSSAAGKSLPPFGIPLAALVAKNVNNVLVTGPVVSADYNINRALDNIPAQFNIGQGAGTIAAFCAFYETTTHNLNMRAIQGELLDFKGDLLPFTDVRPNDADWRAIQQVGATGLIKGINKGAGQFCFVPDSIVTLDEVKPVLTETYTRAFLWFNKNAQQTQFTVGGLLSFISELTLLEPKPLEAKIQKQWKTTYHFKNDFDLNHPLSRREFAVLVNQYLNPFARRVDLSGRIIN